MAAIMVDETHQALRRYEPHDVVLKHKVQTIPATLNRFWPGYGKSGWLHKAKADLALAD